MKEDKKPDKQCGNDKAIENSCQIIGGDFSRASEVSMQLKRELIALELHEDIVSRACTAAFEAEMNVIIHAAAGWLRYYITPEKLRIVIEDMGPGIKDINLAMKEGYSTAPDWVRKMGWGAGMGLPNIKKNSDEFKIDSVVGEGTSLEIIINLDKNKGDKI
ncbi:MAG: anti-sigma regulatory factor [Thermodesulfovibrionia bacterium]|nr:anti-sigma regulatory factor [Thermodesulfovibrionia bacterium]